ncbi:glycoside hydrolase family 88 protein [Thalassotalea agariperforans]
MNSKKSKLFTSISTCLLLATGSLATQAKVWPTDNVEFCHAAFDSAVQQYDDFRKEYTNPSKIPTSFSNGETKFTNPMGWTSGFVGGSFWYLYEHTQDKSWLETATKWTNALDKQQFNRKTHDIGFIMSSTYGNGLRLTENKAYRPILVNAAKTLMERYNPTIGATFSWSWGTWEFPVIIDNMMNLELLFKASEFTGDKTYYDAAVSHATVTMKHHFREDHSSYHLVNYNRTTGLPNHKQTFQGIADDSSWSRGQGWGAYGYTMVYRFTKDEKFLNHARNIVNYILTHKNMPEDLVPYFDYDAPDYPEIKNYKDSSAASLVASALFELADYVEADEAKRYRDAAIKMLRSLSSPAYLAAKNEHGHFLLKQATGHYPANLDLEASLNYGDYYYLEALKRCKALK